MQRNRAVLNVSVPADAKIYVNNQATASQGAQRRYISATLETGRRYSYNVRAEVQRDGKKVAQTKVVYVRAGQASNVRFDLTNDVASTPSATTR